MLLQIGFDPSESHTVEEIALLIEQYLLEVIHSRQIPMSIRKIGFTITEVLGQNAKKLIAHKMSVDAIPAGGGLADGLKFLSNKESIVSGARLATEWVAAAIDAIRGAADPNPWKFSTDEEIAGHILNQIAARKQARTIRRLAPREGL